MPSQPFLEPLCRLVLTTGLRGPTTLNVLGDCFPRTLCAGFGTKKKKIVFSKAATYKHSKIYTSGNPCLIGLYHLIGQTDRAVVKQRSKYQGRGFRAKCGKAKARFKESVAIFLEAVIPCPRGMTPQHTWLGLPAVTVLGFPPCLCQPRGTQGTVLKFLLCLAGCPSSLWAA